MTKKILETIRSYLKKNEIGPLHDFLKNLRVGDISEAIKSLDEDERKTVFGLLGVESASGLFHKVNIHLIGGILKDWDNARLAKILDITAPDDGADVLGVLPHKKREKILRLMDEKKAKEVQKLLIYDEKTAGGIMTTDFIALSQDLRAKEALEYIRKNVNVETVHYLYVIDREEHLVGALPLRRLISISPEREEIILKDIMTSNVITTNLNTDQEEIAKLVAQHNLLALPVVDEEGKMVGRITVDDVIDVIHQEANEDFYKMAGALWEAGYLDKPIFKRARMRLPWLITCLFGGFITGSVISLFRGTISKVVALSFFIPVIMDMGGNVGTQSSTIIVRGMATGDIDVRYAWKFLYKEIFTGLLMGMVCGMVISLASWLWQRKVMLGVAVGTAMFAGLTIAATVGTLLPVVFKRFNIDPAVAAGPFITTVIDIVAIAIYLGLSTLLIHFLV